MSSSSSTTSTRSLAFIRLSYHPASPIPLSVEHPARVARILISEPHDDISALLELVVRRLGHEPVILGATEAGSALDAAVSEPAGSDGLRLARELSERDVPVLFASIYPPDANALAVRPFACLGKPFPRYALERALVQALAAAVPAEPLSIPS